MNIQNDVPLDSFSTMRLGGKATYLTEVTSRTELTDAIKWADEKGLKIVMIGDGSNIVWTDKGFSGLVIVNKIMGYTILADQGTEVYITIGSGENWDSVVERTVTGNLSGIEALSLIPGTAGATPIQNVGAYGQEIANVLVGVEAYDHHESKFINLPRSDCNFSYRNSRFKSSDKGRFFITAITLHLSRTELQPPYYRTLQEYLTTHNITDHSPAAIRKAVIDIRSNKLPDPEIVANNGSFFANPIVDAALFIQLRGAHEDIVFWDTSDGSYKLSAAWLIEQAGFKDFHDRETGMATWPKQSLVLVNEHAETTKDLLDFKKKIVEKVQSMFGVELQQEPELLGEA